MAGFGRLRIKEMKMEISLFKHLKSRMNELRKRSEYYEKENDERKSIYFKGCADTLREVMELIREKM